jgi:hypothetical protein
MDDLFGGDEVRQERATARTAQPLLCAKRESAALLFVLRDFLFESIFCVRFCNLNSCGVLE